MYVLQTFLEENLRPVLYWFNQHQQYVLVSCLTASNYKSSTSYFNQLDQQADGVYFWTATSASFMNPMELSPSTKEAEPGTTATNQTLL